MASFDPAAATAAYMATLSPAAHAKAAAYTHGGYWLMLWSWLATVIAAWLIVRSGLLVRAEVALERKRPRLILVSLVVGALYVILDFVLELPWEAYSRWWREKAYGLTSQAFGGWLTEQLIGLVISVAATALFLAALYALIRRAPRTWWIWAGALVAGFLIVIMILAPVFIMPLFNTYTPAPPGQVRDAVVALAEKAGVPHDKIFIYNGSKQSNRYSANVAGLGGTARVAMSDVMFAKGADIAEVRGVVGHEMGHYKLGHTLWLTLADSLLAMAALGLIQWSFPWASRAMGGPANIADPAGLPVIAAVFATLALVGAPISNTITRTVESQADAFSLRVANEPDGLSKALVKTIEYRASSPSDLEEFLFYDHPSVEHRVRRAMEWKAAHPAG
ncbi:MAG TPA: M48 family metalloprotease [Caulobacteraceae bacterium]|nr:M48 family metalloprotease [Caulobacteraceae bacterium]